MSELKQKTELQTIMRQCVEDVRIRREKLEEIALKKNLRPSSARTATIGPGREGLGTSASARRRPHSARPALGCRRPLKGPMHSSLEEDRHLSEEERNQVVEALLQREEVLKVVAQSAFPSPDSKQQCDQRRADSAGRLKLGASRQRDGVAQNGAHRDSLRALKIGQDAIASAFLSGK
ncbi:unnamed protein product [Ostreobium quekettii]|uniref:Uncharacterized protein n=1 Tax=Ostreobium quekettii TaxID=121088 RepID=A0A8S1J7I8_9CHLO|nr:unnamed protein product [Ostreobium quekettii]